MPRLRPRQLKLDGDKPVAVSDLKDGEVRLHTDGIYARVGNQVLLDSWTGIYLTTTTTTTTTTT